MYSPIPEFVFALLFITGILFVVIILPIWLCLHYARSKRVHRLLAREDRQELRNLEEKAEDMADRIEALESILDSETPKWRRRRVE